MHAMLMPAYSNCTQKYRHLELDHPAQLSATFLTSTSVTVTAQYNVAYTVSVVATNCAGNSTTAEYNFMISELTA